MRLGMPLNGPQQHPLSHQSVTYHASILANLSHSLGRLKALVKWRAICDGKNLKRHRVSFASVSIFNMNSVVAIPTSHLAPRLCMVMVRAVQDECGAVPHIDHAVINRALK